MKEMDDKEKLKYYSNKCNELTRLSKIVVDSSNQLYRALADQIDILVEKVSILETENARLEKIVENLKGDWLEENKGDGKLDKILSEKEKQDIGISVKKVGNIEIRECKDGTIRLDSTKNNSEECI